MIANLEERLNKIQELARKEQRRVIREQEQVRKNQEKAREKIGEYFLNIIEKEPILMVKQIKIAKSMLYDAGMSVPEAVEYLNELFQEKVLITYRATDETTRTFDATLHLE